MDAVLEILVKVQKLDFEIHDLLLKKSTLPNTIMELEREYEKLNQEKEKLESLFKKEEVKLRELEVDLKEIQEKIRTFQEKSRQVKTNEEYRAMIAQIEHADMEKRRKEEEIVAQMVLIEKLQKELPEKKASISQKLMEIDTAIKNLKEELALLENRLQNAQQKKEFLIGNLPEKEKQLYLKLQSRLGGSVVCQVLKNELTTSEISYVCSGCYSVLPLHFVQDLKITNTYSRCPNCGRIIYYYEEM